LRRGLRCVYEPALCGRPPKNPAVYAAKLSAAQAEQAKHPFTNAKRKRVKRQVTDDQWARGSRRQAVSAIATHAPTYSKVSKHVTVKRNKYINRRFKCSKAKKSKSKDVYAYVRMPETRYIIPSTEQAHAELQESIRARAKMAMQEFDAAAAASARARREAASRQRAPRYPFTYEQDSDSEHEYFTF
jgi:hypothetical protein